MKHTLAATAHSCALAVFALLVLVQMHSHASAATYYVRTDGNDSNSGTGSGTSQAWATVVAAVTKTLSPGDVVYVKAGTYSGIVAPSVDGTSANPITFIGDKRGSVSGWSAGNVILQAPVGEHALQITADEYLTFRDFHMDGDVGRDTVDVDSLSIVVFERCEVYGGSYGIDVDAATVTIINCLVRDNAQRGVNLDVGTVTVLNSTIVDNGDDGVHLTSGTITVTNCIIANNGGDGIDLNSGTLTHTYNLVYSSGDLDYEGTSASTGEINVDPQFVSSTDYRISILSPARNVGTDLSGTVDDDFEGRARPYDGAYDMGCYEEGPLAHWEHDETSGTTAFDSSGFGHDGTHSGSPTWSTTGIRDGSLDFETSDGADRVDAGNFDVVGTELTLIAWVRQEDPLNDGRIISKSSSNDSQNDQSWGLTIDENGELDFRVTAGGTWRRVQAPGVISPNTWYHVAGTYDGTTMRLYLDGQLIASLVHTSGGAIVGESSQTVTLGDSPVGSRTFDGLIDDARIYDRTLSVDEIVELYGGLVGHWKLDETSGTVAADSSGFSNDGTVNGTVAWTSAIYGNGHDFDYTDGDDYVEIPNTSSLENVQEGSYTLAAWFKPNTIPPGTGTANDASYGILMKEGFQIGLYYTGGGEFEIAHYLTGPTWNGTGTWSTSFPAGKFYHVAGVVDRDAGTIKIYVNGTLRNTETFTPGTAAYEFGTSSWRIGVANPGSSNYSWAADGTVDDARIYSRALTNAEIADLYDLQGHWRLDENSGTTAADSSPQGSDGTYNGSPTLAVGGAYPGDVLTAVDFDGSDDEVDLTDTNIDFSYGLTAAFWVKPADTPGAGQGYAFFDLSNGQDVDEIWIGWFDSVGFQLYMTDTDDGSTLKTIEDNTGFEEGKWVHCVATVDAAGNATLYRNGEVTKSGFYTSIPTNVLRTQNSLATSPLNDEFPGTLDDVRLYNRPLSATEVAELYGLTGHWKMDEGAGATVADSTAFANNATLNGATWTTDCTGKTALEFDGLNDTAATNSNFTPPDTGTVTFWMRGADTPNARGRVFGLNGDWEARQETDGSVSFDLGASPFVGNEPFATPIVDDIYRWYHIVAMFDASDDSYSVYVNGVLEASGISPVNLVTQTAGILSFGTRTGSTEYWLGAMRDFRVYNRWLSGSELSDLSGLVAYWKLDESSGTVAVDSSPNGNDGTYTGGVTLFQAGNIDQAADFDGSDDYVGVPDDPTLQMDDVFSLSAWIRPDSSSNIDQMILNKEGEYEIAISPSDELKWGITNTDPGWSWHSTGHIVAIGKWTHVALIYDNGTVTTYANGVLVDTYNGSGSVGDQYTSLNELRLGGRSNNPTGKYFDGRLDDIRVYKRVLCSEEVFGQYKGGRPAGVRILEWVEVR